MALGEAKVLGTRDCDLGAVAGDDDVALGKVSRLALDLDALIQVFLEGCDIKDLVIDRGCAIDDELDGGLLHLR